MTNKKRPLVFIVGVIAALVLAAVPATADPRMTSLGKDPMLDGPPAADLIRLEAGRAGPDLLLRFHVSSMIPVQGSYPGGGIEWVFDVGAKTFVAEGHPEPGEFRFTLYEVQADSFRQIAALDGSVDWAEAHMTIEVPLRLIGAQKGTRISGTGPKGTEDVEIHYHAGPASRVLDAMATTRDFVVP